jgi:Cu-Zn family superoxide dismutase
MSKRICPVSGKPVDVTTRTPVVEADGEIYHFCSRGHREMFMADPEHFLEKRHMQSRLTENVAFPDRFEYDTYEEPVEPVINEGLNIGSMTVSMHVLTPLGAGEGVGEVTLEDTDLGLMITPSIFHEALADGMRGFHVHENGDLGSTREGGKVVMGGAAGSHYDPHGTGTHQGPYGNGHLGDLPPLYFDDDGDASIPVLAPRLTLQDVYGRTLIVHSGGDNFTDDPPNGGGESRVLGAIIK